MSLLEKERIVEAYERSILKEKEGFSVDTDKKMKDCMDKNAPKMGFDAANRKCSEQINVTAEAEFDVDTDQKYKDCMDKNSKKMGGADAHVYCMEQMNVTVEGKEEDEDEDEDEESDCPDGQRWCPIQKKCITPPGKGKGRADEQELSEQKEQHQQQQLTMIANQIATIVMDPKGRNSALRGLKTHLPTFAVWEKGNKTSFQRDITTALQKALKTQFKDPNIWGPQPKE